MKKYQEEDDELFEESKDSGDSIEILDFNEPSDIADDPGNTEDPDNAEDTEIHADNAPWKNTSGKKEKSKEEEGNSLLQEIMSWIIPLLVAVLVALILKNYVIINANVPTGSMLNTIHEGDDLFGFRLAYTFSDPERGDIVIFKNPDNPSEKFIKRVIGLPGETVVIQDSKIYINGSSEPLEETYLPEEWVICNGPYEFHIPNDSYLMLGDNRNNSKDARYWTNTYVTKDAIIGKAIVIYYPFKNFTLLN